MFPNYKLLLWVFFHFVTTPFLSQSQELFFNGFKDAANNLTLNGTAEIQSNGLLRLTNITSRVIGHAFYSSPIRLKNSTSGKSLSFSTNFAFAIVPELQKFAGHGFAFAMVPSKELPGALPNQYLGLVNTTDNGNFTYHVFAVEFDTHKDYELRDIDDNHVGIDLDGVVSNVSVPAQYYPDGSSTNQSLCLLSGRTILAWIDYDSGKNQLNVTLSLSSKKPSRSILSLNVDLSPYLHDFMYVGFSASTGKLTSSHYLMGWSFKVGGEARPLDLSSLPTLPMSNKPNKALILGVLISTILLAIFSAFIIWNWKNRDVIESWELNIGPHRFPYAELKNATKGFRDKELLGFGGFGRVYLGILPKSNIQVAVKRISNESKQGLGEFLSEIESIGRLRHRNLVPLLGWCRQQRDMLLVYDYMPNGSLDKYLFDRPKMILNWDQRFKIIKGVASGLLYVHEEWEQTVIHRDIKAGNVLLDAELNGRLGDFGLAKLYEHGSRPGTTRVVGTMGYLAPELTKTGKPTTSSDVFAFGALLLEVACGRRPVEPKALPEDLILVDLVWDRWKEGAILNVMDPKLKGHYDVMEALVVLKLGLMCSAYAPSARPTMRQAVRYLEGEMCLPKVIAPPGGCAGKESGCGGGGGGGCGNGGALEHYLHSSPESSYYEKMSNGSITVDIEAGSSLSFSTAGEGR